MLGTLRGKKRLLFNRYRELLFSYIVEETPVVRKNSKMRMSKALKKILNELDNSYVKKKYHVDPVLG